MELAFTAYRALVEASSALRFHLGAVLGRKRLYDIAPGYQHRDRINYYDDTANADEWQREVYLAAQAIMDENALQSVYDVGCGSGYKLIEILGQFETTGIDLPATISRVCSKYPERAWIGASFELVQLPPADLVICADVIEHVADPEALMRFLISSTKDWVVLSTPDRDLAYLGRGKARFGPPANPAHVREWTMQEFHAFVRRFLHVERHEITNAQQATQMIVGRRRDRA